MLETPAMLPLSVVQSVLVLPGELRITEGLGKENVKIGLYIRPLLGKQSTLNFKWKGLYNHEMAEMEQSSLLGTGER